MSKDNKTDQWKTAPPSTLYELPTVCPKCEGILTVTSMHMGTFPYQYVDLNVNCTYCFETYNFCYPQNPIMATGITIYDKTLTLETIENRAYQAIYEENISFCPFHKTYELEMQRFYGDLVFNDGTMKLQIKCPKCNYYKRIQI